MDDGVEIIFQSSLIAMAFSVERKMIPCTSDKYVVLSKDGARPYRTLSDNGRSEKMVCYLQRRECVQ
jgi:hypothetical protein